MYTYLFESIVGFAYGLHWVLALLLALLIPFAAFYVGLILAMLNSGEDSPSLFSILLLPAMALMEGLSYALVTTGSTVPLQRSIWLVLIVAEVVGVVIELVLALKHGYGRPLLFVVGTFLLGFAPFGVMAILGGILFGLQIIGVFILVALFVYALNHTGTFPG